MASVPQPRVSPEEYVELEQKLGLKHEYHDGQMFAMSGASGTHSRLQVNATIEVGTRLRGTKCEAYSADFRVVIEAADMATYPDLSVICGPVEPSKRYRNSCTNPTVLIEVLSPSTERYDRGAKFEQYRKLASLREYVLVSQHEASVDLFRLENGHWVLYEVRGEAAVLELSSIGIEIPMSDLYYNVRFEDAEPE
jgi:Uma2 family endonuclease